MKSVRAWDLRDSCRYFGVCGGGAPVNKMFENRSLVSGETSFGRLSIQAAADALLKFLDRQADDSRQAAEKSSRIA